MHWMTVCFFLIAGVAGPARAAEPGGGPDGKKISTVGLRCGHLIDGREDRARGARNQRDSRRLGSSDRPRSHSPAAPIPEKMKR